MKLKVLNKKELKNSKRLSIAWILNTSSLYYRLLVVWFSWTRRLDFGNLIELYKLLSRPLWRSIDRLLWSQQSIANECHFKTFFYLPAVHRRRQRFFKGSFVETVWTNRQSDRSFKWPLISLRSELIWCLNQTKEFELFLFLSSCCHCKSHKLYQIQTKEALLN